MGRKVFISVLGSSNYACCKYKKDEFLSLPVRFIQEATIDYHLRTNEWNADDLVLILMTEGARCSNWVDNGHTNRDTGEAIECEGLHTRLEMMNMPCRIVTIEDLPNGNSEEEIWEIFNKVFEAIGNNDEIYFDITHGFRFLPMLVLTLSFYAKFLKGIRIASVTYGNYESRNKTTDIAPIIDLTSLPAVLDWSFAAGQFVDSGSVKRLCELCDAELKPILRDPDRRDESTILLNKYIKSLATLVDDLYLCRGANIIDASTIKSVKERATENVKTFISPLNPIFKKVNESLEPFDPNSNVMNTIYAARWCFEKGLYQQSATILQEGIVSFFASRHNIQLVNERERGFINIAFACLADSTILEREESIPDKVNEIMTDELLGDRYIVNKFAHLTRIRNDYNHSGMRSSQVPMQPTKIKRAIEECLRFFEEYFAECCEEPVEKPVHNVGETYFINISNHPSDKWDEKQRNAALEYGSIVDIPFPEIDTNDSTEKLALLADEYLGKIKAIASPYSAVVHLMGEQTFCFSLLTRLQKAGYRCVASTTKRIVQEIGNNERCVVFSFEKFREYELCK